MAAKNKAGIVSALAELPPRELCALLDDARRKAEAEAQREAEAKRQAEAEAKRRTIADLRSLARRANEIKHERRRAEHPAEVAAEEEAEAKRRERTSLLASKLGY